MPGYILHVNMGLQCTHKTTALLTPAQMRVTVSGQFAATTMNVIQVVPGCPFQVPIPPPPSTKPQPCATIKWANVSTRVKIMGQPLLLQAPPGPGTGAGVCQSAEQIPQGFPTVSVIQMRVTAL